MEAGGHQNTLHALMRWTPSWKHGGCPGMRRPTITHQAPQWAGNPPKGAAGIDPRGTKTARTTKQRPTLFQIYSPIEQETKQAPCLQPTVAHIQGCGGPNHHDWAKYSNAFTLLIIVITSVLCLMSHQLNLLPDLNFTTTLLKDNTMLPSSKWRYYTLVISIVNHWSANKCFLTITRNKQNEVYYKKACE